MRMPIVTRPGRRFAPVNVVSPRIAASVGVPPPGVALFSAVSNALLGRFVYAVAGSAGVVYGAPVLQLKPSEPEKNWSAAPWSFADAEFRYPESALMPWHHFEFTVCPMLQSPGFPLPAGSPMLPDLSSMMYMSTGAKHAPPSPPDEPDVPELPLVPLLPPKP